MSEELKKKIKDLLPNPTMGSFASIKDGKPWVRYVMINTKDNLDIFFTTHKRSRKVAQLQNDPWCHITAGGDPKNFMHPYLQITGKAYIIEDLAVKKEFWHDFLATMFTGPDDPDYVIIKVVPEEIELWGETKMVPQVLKLKKE